MSPTSIAALVLPKSKVGEVLQILNSGQPRWGNLLAKRHRDSGKTYEASNKGVYILDYRDETVCALRAIELPPPLDEALAHSRTGILSKLISEGTVRYEPSFEPLPDPEDLHPCPAPTWTSELQPLPAMDRECHGSDSEGVAFHNACAQACSYSLKEFVLEREGNILPKEQFRFIELFAGIGGFRIALESLGGHCVFASEMHPTARAVYAANWPSVQHDESFEGDIRLVPADEVPDHDILVGGFPCQPFSALGKQDGLADCRGRLFLHICRILRTKQPRAALLENVPGLLSCDEGAALDEVIKGLEGSGYRVAHRILDSSLVLPQRRRRVYIVAIRADLSAACESFRFPWLPSLSRTLSEALENPLPEQQRAALTIADKYWQKLLASRAYEERPEDIVARLDEPAAPLISGYGSSKSVGQFAYVTQFVPQENSRPRLFTQRECARLQGFPESFCIGQCTEQHLAWYKRIGNAVSVPVVAAVAGALLSALQSRDQVLPGTRAALVAVLNSCPESDRMRLLAENVALPSSRGSVSVRGLLHALASDEDREQLRSSELLLQRSPTALPSSRCFSLRMCCFSFL